MTGNLQTWSCIWPWPLEFGGSLPMEIFCPFSGNSSILFLIFTQYLPYCSFFWYCCLFFCDVSLQGSGLIFPVTPPRQWSTAIPSLDFSGIHILVSTACYPVLQLPNHLTGFLLYSLQFVSICLVLRSSTVPKWVLKIITFNCWLYYCWYTPVCS